MEQEKREWWKKRFDPFDFRQINNTEPTQSIALKFLEDGTRIRLTDLIDGTQRDVTVGADGEVDFSIPKAAGFKFMKYEVSP